MTTSLDPRIERTRTVVLGAAIDVVADRGFAGATIEEIAKRSRVARSTIYRHWPDRLDLLLEAVTGRIPVETLVTGDLRADLISILGHLADLLSSDPMGSVAASLILEARRDPALDALRERFVTQRRAAARAVIAEAMRSGDLPDTADPGELADELAASVLFRTLVAREPADSGWVQDRVDALLRGTWLTARADARS